MQSTAYRVSTYRGKKRPVVDLPTGAATRVLPEFLHHRSKHRFRGQETCPSQGTFHSSFRDVPHIEAVVVHEERGKTQRFLVDLLYRFSDRRA